MKRLFLGFMFLFPLLLWAQQDYVVFSRSGGVYDDPFLLTLQCNNPQNHIYYTLNGGTPTRSSHLYTQPLQVNRQLYSSSNFYQQHITPPDENQFLPDSIFRAIVIRAAVFDEAGNRVSSVVTQSYFIQSLGCDFHGLPVMSLCADSVDLFDFNTGIMVPGVHLVEDNPHWTGNYYMTEREWERLCNVEYYAENNGGFNQQAGVRTHGGNGRRFDQKGLKIYAREEYGKKRFSYKIFDDLDINSFKRLVLKPFKGAWTEAGLQDMLSAHIARNLNLDILDTRPVVLFLNGEYWGLYFLHEKADERYVEDHYDIDHDLCNIMGNWDSAMVSGDGSRFVQMMNWLETADLSDSVQYQQISDQIDINNFIDYQIMEIFIANEDWPANNMRCWQVFTLPWRWIFYDGDGGFRRLQNVFANAVSESIQDWPTNAKSTLMFRRLLQNGTFRKQFIKRYNELSDSYLAYSYTGNCLRNIQNQIQDEIPRQSFRFGKPTNLNSWKQAIKDVDRFLQKRPQIMLDSMKVFFNIPENPSDIFSDAVVFPNPTTGNFSIRFQSESYGVMQVTIKDMLGRVCYANTFFYDEGENVVPVQCNLRGGTYIVSIGKTSKKLVVSR